MEMPAAPAPSRRKTKKTTSFQHAARVLALQVLYEVDVTGHDWEPSLQAHAESAEASERVVKLAESTVRGVLEALAGLDEIITRHAPMFPVSQLAPVDRNVLRLALFELQPGSSVPPKVAINEAIELAKGFGGEASSRFINGVLGAALEELSPTTTTTKD